MRWPFTKKTGEPTIPPVEEQRWAVAQGQSDDAPLLARVNESARDLVGHPGLPIKLGFAIPLNRPNEGGLPDAEENEDLLTVEDLIVTQVLEASVGIHALTLTNGVMKEYVFYVPDGLDFARTHLINT